MAPSWPAIRAGIFAGESGGDYNALFGFSNRPGQPFANVRLTDMTVDQALAFADPSGPYAQWVKNKIGRVATPMGGFQVVGTTLREAKEGLGLTGNERMTPETQDRIGQWILAKQGTGAWEGYKGPGDPSAFPATSALPAPDQEIGGDSLVPRTYPGLEPASTFSNPSPLATGGVLADANPLPAGLGAYWAGDEKKTLGERLAAAGKALAQAVPDAPSGHLGGGGNARAAGGMLAEALQNRGSLAEALFGKRTRGIL